MHHGTSSGPAADDSYGPDPLDPSGWDPATVRETLAPGAIGFDHHAAAATGERGMLVGSTGPFATLAGRQALEAGGSATDAVLTTAFTQIALALGSWVSYAGLFGLVHHDAATGNTATISGGFGTFADESDPAGIPAASEPSGRTALVPGFVAGAHDAHTRFGRLRWDRLWSPARYLVEHGVPVTSHLERMLTIRADVLTRTEEGRACFAPQGRLPQAGERLAQPLLAASLAALAEQGPEWMYQGLWAEQFVASVRRDGGRVRLDDLARYRARCASPLFGGFAGHTVAVLPEPDRGGVTLLDALARIEDAGLGDPAEDPVALAGFLDVLDYGPGAGSHSDYVVAVDAQGNTAALCHSINTPIWGTTGIVVGGIPIPDPAAFQQPVLARLAPGEHLPMPVEPAIALRDNQPVLACSSVGAGLHPVTVLGLHRVLGLGQSVVAAASAPLVHAKDITQGDSVTSLVTRRDTAVAAHILDDRFNPEVLEATRARGHALSPRPVDDPTLPRGFWAAIARSPHDRQLHGARTPYGQGPVRAL